MIQDDYVAWVRYHNGSISTCDSDSEGAFKVYRWPRQEPGERIPTGDWRGTVIINGVELVETCFACPEQYDAFIDGKRVAYLRLRHGYFYASCPWVEGDVVYEAEPKGDGLFESDEREKYLTEAVNAIKAWVAAQAQNRGIIYLTSARKERT